ncbi:MAG: DUF4249 family protein [Saprospiraceae bacterium]|uniref:DUF4249 family protein n=1 Tax=Candidatus Defluviibacterium haderslevense TaxID=2981993 RepID=A0A9D7SD72_9BACT|nr:DUF4249 family protein [Candidatus Defluviibacterium haderslevense]
MKRIKGLVLLCLLGSLSCSEDFQLTEPWKDIPVVYGFINVRDTAQYVRVERLFVDENIPASQIAKNVDSLYYKNAVVSLVNLTKNRNKDYILTMVDANLEGYMREDGPFATSPNYIYKIRTSDMVLNSGDSILFKLNRSAELPLVTARIVVLNDMSFSTPADDQKVLVFKPSESQQFAWSAKNDAKIFDFIINIFVQEVNVVTSATEIKKIVWSAQKGDFSKKALINNQSFYNILRDRLIVDGNIKRQILKVDLEVKAGGQDLLEFNSIVNANTGITASQEIPRYSNLSEGFGLFASTATLVRTMGISSDTKSYLKTDPATSALNFQ